MKITQIKIPSGNYTKGRSRKVTTVIIHWIVGNLSAADGVFKNPSTGLSAHYAIENSTIHQYVKESDTAHHAIQANPFSIGIEHSAAPGRKASEATYKTSAKLVAEICKRHKLDPRKVVKPHNAYVATQCPGTVLWKRIANEAYKLMQGEDMYKNNTAEHWYNRTIYYKDLVTETKKSLAALKKEFDAYKKNNQLEPLQKDIRELQDRLKVQTKQYDTEITGLQNLNTGLSEELLKVEKALAECAKNKASLQPQAERASIWIKIIKWLGAKK